MATFKLGRNPVAFRKVVVWSASTDAALSTSPTITSGSAAPSANEPVGSLYLRTGGSSFESIVYAKTASGAGAGNWEAASGTNNIVIPSSSANAFVIEAGTDDMFVINTDTDGLVFGNASTNPTYTFLGNGTASFNGGVYTNTLTERTADSGIAIPAGVEILGVPKVESVQVAYDTSDGALFTVPSGQVWLITDVWFQTQTDWDGNGAFIVGVTADPDGFLTLANASLDPAYDESGGAAGWPTGSRGLDSTNRGPLLAVPTTGYARAYRAVAGTTVLIDNTPGTSSQGAGTLFMRYTRLL